MTTLTSVVSVSLTKGSLIAQAEDYLLRGCYSDSLKVLDFLAQDPVYAHLLCDRLNTILMRSRIYLHMGLDIEAMELIEKAPAGICDFNPILYADLRIINGILIRRKARRLWKSGKISEALEMADKAIMEFNLAESAAQQSGHYGKRLFYNAQLNKYYTIGLVLAITKAPAEKYRSLLIDAIIAEYGSRQNMPPETRELVSGTTILADIALGASISDIQQIRLLSDDQKFIIAFRGVFGCESSWPVFILSQCRGFSTFNDAKTRVINIQYSTGARQDSIAKALILGCRMLLKESEPDAYLLNAYVCDLHYCSEMLKRNGSEGTREGILEVLRAIPKHFYNNRRYPMFARFFN